MMKDKRGFTLIELLVAMTIVAVLAGVSLVSYQGARKNARDGKRKTDLEQIRSAAEMCRADTGSYPVGTLSSGDPITCDSQTYLTIPQDPLSGRQYIYTGDVDSYILCASLEISEETVSGCGSCGSEECNYNVVNP